MPVLCMYWPTFPRTRELAAPRSRLIDEKSPGHPLLLPSQGDSSSLRCGNDVTILPWSPDVSAEATTPPIRVRSRIDFLVSGVLYQGSAISAESSRGTPDPTRRARVRFFSKSRSVANSLDASVACMTALRGIAQDSADASSPDPLCSWGQEFGASSPFCFFMIRNLAVRCLMAQEVLASFQAASLRPNRSPS